MSTAPDRRSRLAGGLLGLLVGDAMGVPYEFHRPEHLPAFAQIEMTPPDGFARAHASVPPGTWSDDGAHALCLLASLLRHDGLDPEDLMRRLANWYEHGYLAVDGHVFDVGIQTARALGRFRAGVAALECGPADVHDNGNGSLMRVLPLALWHRGTDAELAHDAMRQSRITHGHPRARMCCALYCLWARRLLEARTDAWSDAVATLRGLIVDTPEEGELEFHLRPDLPPDGNGTGYVVDCLRSARLALEHETYEDVVRAAIALGHDTDTTACVAGGLAGIRHGVDAIPLYWRSALRGPELLQPLLQALLARG